MKVRGHIVVAISSALQKLGIAGIEPVLEHPAELSHGDYSTNVALVAAKRQGASPREVAEKIVAKLGTVEGVSKIEVAGAGFINFHLSRESLAESVSEILKTKDAWGRNEHVKGRKVILEYSQPNPFKPFHIGHLMSTTIGETLSRIVESSGARVFRVNYQGDIGPHVAKCIWGLLKTGGDPHDVSALGEAYVFGNNAYEDDSNAKKEIDDLNRRLYEDDQKLKEIYDAGRATSLAHFEEIYKILGTHFDHYFFESETGPIGLAMVKTGLAKGIFEASDGAIVYKGEKAGLHTRVFVTAKGIQTYETKELGLAKAKFNLFPFDLNITTVAVEQDSYFNVVVAALSELWPEIKGKYTHVSHGMLELTSGKMSSRKGNVITGESLLEEMRAKAREKIGGRDLGDAREAVADAVAVAAIKYSVLKQATGKNIIFDPEKSLSFEGDSGPYLQYAHVRALSVLRKAAAEGVPARARGAPKGVIKLERLLYRFPEVIERAAAEYEPHYITTFLTEIAGVFNSWYAQEKIVDASDPTSYYKVALTQAFTATMKNGLWVLGIPAPEKM